VELNILRGQARQKVRRVQVPVFLIGSAVDCDLVLKDPRLPEVHTYLYVTRKSVSVRHLGIGPAVFVRGDRVESAELRHGDRVEIGDAFEFELKIESRAEALGHDGPMIIRWDIAQQRARMAGVSNRQVLLSPT
jgi:pSer/pThr/pTyr-binding forkhead associated (FHA) protein